MEIERSSGQRSVTVRYDADHAAYAFYTDGTFRGTYPRLADAVREADNWFGRWVLDRHLYPWCDRGHKPLTDESA